MNGIVLKKSQLYAFYHIGTGLKRHLKIARCWSNGKVPVRTFSNAASVELFLNGESLGKKEFTKKTTEDDVHIMRGLNKMNCILSGL